MKIVQALRAPSPHHRTLFWQIVRYGLTGVGVTAVQAAIYWLLATHAGFHAQSANLCGYIVAVGVGYVLHGRFSFRGHGSRDRSATRGAKFVIVSLVSLALNATWVWLCLSWAGWPTWSPIPAMFFVTPAIVFVLNRQWVFR
jgi:putative flippase GtrA